MKQVYKTNDLYQAIPPIEDNMNIIADNIEKATLFNLFFQKASTIDETNKNVPEMLRLFDGQLDFSDVLVTDQDVRDQLKLLDTTKAYGPDCIPPMILKEGGDTVVKQLTRLFNLTLVKMQIPQIWKQANVIPIHK